MIKEVQQLVTLATIKSMHTHINKLVVYMVYVAVTYESVGLLYDQSDTLGHPAGLTRLNSDPTRASRNDDTALFF